MESYSLFRQRIVIIALVVFGLFSCTQEDNPLRPDPQPVAEHTEALVADYDIVVFIYDGMRGGKRIKQVGGVGVLQELRRQKTLNGISCNKYLIDIRSFPVHFYLFCPYRFV